jgi:hypothetical protein
MEWLHKILFEPSGKAIDHHVNKRSPCTEIEDENLASLFCATECAQSGSVRATGLDFLVLFGQAKRTRKPKCND